MIKIHEKGINDSADGLVSMGRDETATQTQQNMQNKATRYQITLILLENLSKSDNANVLNMMGEPETPPTGIADGRVK